MTTGEELVAFARKYVTDNAATISYHYGDHPDPSEKNPTTFDCSGFVRWIVGQFPGADVGPTPQTGYQYRYCRDHADGGEFTDVRKAYNTPGALLFRTPEGTASAHVAISVGDGIQTVEAIGTNYGVKVGQINETYRSWTHAVMIPGIRYPAIDTVPIGPRADDCILDTRPDKPIAYSGAKPDEYTTISFPVRGVNGIAADATAVMLNVTAVQAPKPGFVTVFPSTADPKADRPLASNLNLDEQNHTMAALVTVPVGDDGRVCIYTQKGAHLVVHPAAAFRAGDGFTPLNPTRVLDTRADSRIDHVGDKPAAGQTVDVQITGNPRLAIEGASAVVLTVTAVDATAPGYVTAWPSGLDRPTASNLNLFSANPIANQVIVPVGANGKVSLFTQSGAHLLVDVSGWFAAASVFQAVAPARLLDTRSDAPIGHPGGRPGPGGTVPVQVLGAGGVPARGVREVVLNVTATNTIGPGYVAIWPSGAPPRTSSILSICRAGQTVPNLTVVPVGADGKVVLCAQPGADLIADVVGYTKA